MVGVFHTVEFIYLSYFCHQTPNCPHLASNFALLVYLSTVRNCHFLVTFIFLRAFPPQLPEPLILFRYYNDFIGLAKESQSVIMEELEALRLSPSPVSPAQISVDLNRVLFKIRDLLRQLPPAHYKTLQFLIEHLYRYAGGIFQPIIWQHPNQ